MKEHISPPRWPWKLLKWFLNKDYLEELQGDMDEVFEDDLLKVGHQRAKRRYLVGTIRLFRPSLLRTNRKRQKLNQIDMLKHYIAIALRAFSRHKTSFLINIIGLSTGLAASLLILLWVNDERKVDTFHENDARLYRIMTHFQLSDQIETWDYSSGRMGQAMVDEFPEVEDAVRIGHSQFQPSGVITYQNDHFQTKGLFASPNFFQVLSYELLSGQAESVLNSKDQILLSEDNALRIFGSIEKAIGQSIEVESRFFSKDFIISGVFAKPPTHATLQFEFVVNYDLLIDRDSWANEWNGGYAENYLLLKEGTDIEAFNAKIENYLDDKVNNEKFTVFAIKYSDLYLYGNYQDGRLLGGRISSVQLYTLVAILILVIACINFMNLSTAQASKKMKEIGVKKAIGAHKGSLIFQFLTESLLITFISLLLALGLVYMLLPQFNELTGKDIYFNWLEFLPKTSLLALLVGLLAGSYPAFYLSGFQPVQVLKGQFNHIKGEAFIRKGLVILQFSLSIIFIIAVIVINRQIKFTQNQHLGYDRQHIITFESKGLTSEKLQTFIQALHEIPGVQNSGNMAGEFLWGEDSASGYWTVKEPDGRNHIYQSPKMGYQTIETLNLKLLEGRTFDKRFNDDRKSIILNEAAVKYLKLENPSGAIINYGQNDKREVIGVIKDFQYGSMHQAIEPMVIRFRDWGPNCIVKLKPGLELETLRRIELLYEEFHPKYAFTASYLADDYAALYDTETKESILSNYMAGIAIIISCLGLFGLAAFTAERRTKEIGIRKILGANQGTIIALLTSSFTKTVLISIVLAIPIAYLFAKEWLKNFAYSIELNWWIFALAGISCLLMAWLAMSTQVIKAARVNPAISLRNE
jgi:ABC-type antimicrobial peptide transport system permease subunit